MGSANLTTEYFKAQDKFRAARTKEDKIKALEEMLREVPKHKGTEKIQAQIKRKLAKIKKEKTASAKAKPSFTLRKEGAGRVCIVGLPNSGKSTLLNKLTNIKAKVAGYAYTTTKPVFGMLSYKEIKIQIIEFPATFNQEYASVIRDSDLICFLLKDNTETERKKLIKKTFGFGIRIKGPLKEEREVLRNAIFVKRDTELKKIKEQIFQNLNIIRVFTKSKGTIKSPPMVLQKGANVKQAVRKIHKDFLRDFKYAKVSGPSAKFKGKVQTVGLEHILKDSDVLEVHTK